MRKIGYILIMVFSGFLVSCSSVEKEEVPGEFQQPMMNPSLTESPNSSEEEILEPDAQLPSEADFDDNEVPSNDEPTAEPIVEEDNELFEPLGINPEQWQDWPLLPVVSEEMREVYQSGLAAGRDPKHFSIFGDCQSLPDVYMGGYETGEFSLPDNLGYLQSTIDWFAGSFNRTAPTIKKGTTTAAILWEGWVDEENQICEYGETPLECEIRLHNPSIVIINLGTHWEVRNGSYLRKIIELLIDQGIVPILSTKADTREGDAWINEELVQIASEYHVPVWNFWRSVQGLENNGMIPNDAMYLSEEGLLMQRITSLQAIDSVYRQLNGLSKESEFGGNG